EPVCRNPGVAGTAHRGQGETAPVQVRRRLGGNSEPQLGVRDRRPVVIAAQRWERLIGQDDTSARCKCGSHSNVVIARTPRGEPRYPAGKPRTATTPRSGTAAPGPHRSTNAR